MFKSGEFSVLTYWTGLKISLITIPIALIATVVNAYCFSISSGSNFISMIGMSLGIIALASSSSGVYHDLRERSKIKGNQI